MDERGDKVVFTGRAGHPLQAEAEAGEGRGGGAPSAPGHSPTMARVRMQASTEPLCCCCSHGHLQAAAWWTAAAVPRLSGASARGNVPAVQPGPPSSLGSPRTPGPGSLSLGIGRGTGPPIATMGLCASWKRHPLSSQQHTTRPNCTWHPCENSPWSRPGAYNYC